MKKSLPVILLFLFVSVFSFAQSLTWTPITDYYEPRYAPYTFMLGSRFFLGGGLDSSSTMTATNDLEEYNFQTSQWESRASLPAGITMYDERQFVIGGMGYTTCGQLVPTSGGYMSTLYQYNPILDQWSAKAAFPGTPRYTPSTFSIGNYGYLGMGYVATHSDHYVNDFWQYDPDADAWTQITSFPGAERQAPVNFVINGMAYVGLGSSTVYMTDMYRFDTTSGGTWTQMANFPGTPRSAAASFVLNNIGYVVGGINSSQVALSDIWSYNPANNTWAAVDTFAGLALWDIVAGGNGYTAIAGTGRDSTGNFSSHLYQAGFPTGISQVISETPKTWSNGDKLHIVFSEPLSVQGSLVVYDVAGREISATALTTGQSSYILDYSSYASGLYLYSIQSPAFSNVNGKMIIGN